jgi:hypothetical protein
MDLRPSYEAAQDAFGVPAVVTLPDASTVDTTVIWLPPVTVEVPVGNDFRRVEQWRVLALPRADVPQVERGTVVQAAEEEGGDESLWRVDSVLGLDSDHTRCVMVAHE